MAGTMNKTYINILCLIILGLLAVKVLLPFLGVGNSVVGNADNHSLTETHTPFVTKFTANKLVPFTPTDTLTFSSGEKFPVISRQIEIFIPDEEVPTSVRLTSGISYIALWALVLLGFYQFLRFIININRSKIFIADNVKRLRLFGWLLLASAAIMIISGLSESSLINAMDLSYSDRTLKAVWEFPWTLILVGLASLLMGQIWHRGIMLREDNELTI